MHVRMHALVDVGRCVTAAPISFQLAHRATMLMRSGMPAPCDAPVRLFMVAMRTYFSAMMMPGWRGRGQRQLPLHCLKRLADAMCARW